MSAIVGTRLTFLAALLLGALGVLAYDRVTVVHKGVALGAVVASANLVAAQVLVALAVLALHLSGFVDRSISIRALERVAVDRVCDFTRTVLTECR